MRKFDHKTINTLSIATNDYVGIIKKLPKTERRLFLIEGINVLPFWKQVYQTICAACDKGDTECIIDYITAYRFAFFLYHMSLYFTHKGDHQDQAYISAADYFFRTYIIEVGQRDEESLFNNANFRSSVKT